MYLVCVRSVLNSSVLGVALDMACALDLVLEVKKSSICLGIMFS